ncbi:MAG: hypothetical protein HXY40_14850 [Chloroflexi bacterium]|nr:hypothetical protein [Chloroflexota bacterium]
MPLFVIFVFGAWVLGAGTLLAPAWPTLQPRIGLSAAFALALVIGGAIFWAMLFVWDTLLIDYMVFFLISVVFLGGTLSYGQKRAEARGETLEDADQGWPGPFDLALLGALALLLILLVLFVPPPPIIEALPPARGEITAVQPGFRALAAYLEHQLNQPMPQTQFAAGAVLAFLCSWLSYDLGAESKNKRWARFALLSAVLYTAFLLNGQYDLLLGLAFALAFVLYALRYARAAHTVDALGAGLMLGAVLLAHLPLLALLVAAYVVGVIALALRRALQPRWLWAVLLLGVPLLALVAVSPWLLGR